MRLPIFEFRPLFRDLGIVDLSIGYRDMGHLSFQGYDLGGFQSIPVMSIPWGVPTLS
jgi:hypothetical protein